MALYAGYGNNIVLTALDEPLCTDRRPSVVICIRMSMVKLSAGSSYDNVISIVHRGPKDRAMADYMDSLAAMTG